MNLGENYEAVSDAAVTSDTAGNTLTVTAPADTVGAGFRLTFPGAAGDWTAAQCLAFTLRANGAHRLRFDLVHGKGSWTFYIIPRPGLTSRVVIPVADLLQRPHNTSEPGYSRFGG